MHQFSLALFASLVLSCSALAQSTPQAKPTAPVLGLPQKAPQVPSAVGTAPAKPLNLDEAQKQTLTKISAAYNSIKEMNGTFSQVEENGTKTTGKFYITKPGKVRFQYDKPVPLELVADGDSVVIRDRKLNTQDLYPLSQTPLRYLLKENVDLLKDAKVVNVLQDQDLITITIEEKGTFTEGQLTVFYDAKDFSLKQWTITDATGQDTNVAIENVVLNQPNQKKLFEIDYSLQMPGPR